jgi:hypothetical protein
MAPSIDLILDTLEAVHCEHATLWPQVTVVASIRLVIVDGEIAVAVRGSENGVAQPAELLGDRHEVDLRLKGHRRIASLRHGPLCRSVRWTAGAGRR